MTWPCGAGVSAADGFTCVGGEERGDGFTCVGGEVGGNGGHTGPAFFLVGAMQGGGSLRCRGVHGGREWSAVTWLQAFSGVLTRAEQLQAGVAEARAGASGSVLVRCEQRDCRVTLRLSRAGQAA